MERAGDTRTPSPCIYKDQPWSLSFKGNLGLDMGNFEQFQVGGGGIFQQNFGDFAYLVQADYLYLTRGGSLVRHRGGGTLRGDFHLADLSENVKLSLPIIGTAVYDNVLKLEPRVTLGGGLWVDFISSDKMFYNGFSTFVTAEYERGGGVPEDWTPRLSLRDYFKAKLSDKIKFTLDSYFVPSMEDAIDFRASVSPGFTFMLTDQFGLTLTGAFEYASRPRDPSLEHYDFNTMFGFTVDLGPME